MPDQARAGADPGGELARAGHPVQVDVETPGEDGLHGLLPVEDDVHWIRQPGTSESIEKKNLLLLGVFSHQNQVAWSQSAQLWGRCVSPNKVG